MAILPGARAAVASGILRAKIRDSTMANWVKSIASGGGVFNQSVNTVSISSSIGNANTHIKKKVSLEPLNTSAVISSF